MEVEHLRSALTEKESKEKDQIEHLSEQVNYLQTELEKAKNLSQMDGLTGVYNRKAFDEYIEDMVARNDVLGKPLSMLLLDIDDFKSINDDFGHLIGDRVLLAFANKCKRAIREEDYLARYGGEEFVIVLPGATLRNASKKAKQICKSIARTQYSTDEAADGRSLSITVSIGVSALNKGDTSQALMNRADKALYIAKRTGKNRVVNEKKI